MPNQLDVRSQMSDLRKTRIPIFLYIAIIVLGTVVLGVGWAKIYVQKQKNISSRISVSPTPKKLSNIEIAQKTLDWLNLQKDERGVYTVGTECIGEQCVRLSTNRSGFSVLWARNRLIKKTNNQVQKNIFLEDLNAYLDTEKVKLIQNNFWNCLFMYRILEENKEFEESVKEKVRNVCLRGEYLSGYGLTPSLAELKETTKEDALLALDLEKSENEMTSGQEEYVEDPVGIGNKDAFYFLGADRMAKILLLQKEQKSVDHNLQLDAYVDFSRGLGAYREGTIYPYQGCYVGTMSVMMSKLENNNIFIDLADHILDQQMARINIESEQDASICGFLADIIYMETGDKKYKNQIDNILKYWKEKQLDINANGFFTTDGDSKIVKKVKFNGIFAGLLLDK